MNKTKIIATIGPITSDKESIEALAEKGMNVVRLNLSHASHEFCRDVIKKVNEINKECKSNIAVLLDTRGPEIRVGRFDGGYAFLKEGEKVRIYSGDLLGNQDGFCVSYPDFVKEVNIEDEIKLDDGKIELRVLDKGHDFLLCEVLNDGVIEDGKGVNVPGVSLPIPFLSEEDKKDIQFAHEVGVDFLALSFVKSSEDVLCVNDLLIGMNDDHIGILAKIETEDAVEDIDNIIKVSDGVMIARGDLGVEMPLESLPGIQKRVIKKCHEAGKLSIVATEMLASMEMGIRPTRAEVSDVANAVLDGADAIMLSGETTVGKYPMDTVEIMSRIVKKAEEEIHYLDLLGTELRTEKQDITGLIAYSVSDSANRLKCKAIVVPTLSGYTARKVSRTRPSCPIIAMTPNKDTFKSLALYFGVHTVSVSEFHSFDEMMKIATKTVKELLPVSPGDRIVVTGGYPFEKTKSTNFMKIEEL